MSLVLAALLLAPTSAGAMPAPAAEESGSAVIARLAVAADPKATAVARLDSDTLPAGPYTIHYRPGEALDTAWIERQFAANAMLGQSVPLDRITALVQELNLAFIRNGYVNSGLLTEPAEALGDGRIVLRLRLVTGKITAPAVTWTNNHRGGLTPGYITNRLPSARAVPLDGVALERDFRLFAADEAVASVKADLQPGDHPGEARLALLVEPAPRYEAYVGLANDRSPAVGGLHWGAGLAMRNLLAAGDRIAADGGLTAGRPDVQLSYRTPLFTPGVALWLRGSANRAAVIDAPLRELDIRSRDWAVEGGLTGTLFARPLSPAEDGGGRETSARTVTVTAGAVHRETQTFLLGEPFSFSPGSVRGRAAYTAARVRLDWAERGSNAVWLVGIGTTVGIDGSRSDIVGIPNPGRHFVAVIAEASHARRLGDSGFELRARVVGQITSGPVYSGERFSAGGSQSVRGYRENLLLADEGAFGSVEIAHPLRLGRGRKGGLGLEWGSLTPSLFLEGAVVHNRDTALQPDPRRIASVGAALAWTPSTRLSARVSYGLALVDAQVAGSRDLQDAGIAFALSYRLALL